MSHPRHSLDEVIHSPVRFSIMALLAAADKAEFGYVRDTVEVSDSVLSRQVAILESSDYVAICKGYVGKWPRTWLSLTERGRAAFDAHCVALRLIAEGAAATSLPTNTPASSGEDGSSYIQQDESRRPPARNRSRPGEATRS